MMGRGYSSSDLVITIYAYDGFTSLAKNYGFWKYAKPTKRYITGLLSRIKEF